MEGARTGLYFLKSRAPRFIHLRHATSTTGTSRLIQVQWRALPRTACCWQPWHRTVYGGNSYNFPMKSGLLRDLACRRAIALCLAMGLARGAATPRQLVPRPRSLARCCRMRPPQSLAGALPRELAQLAVDCRCLARPLSESRACRRSPARLPKAAPRSIVRSPPRELVRPSHTRIRRTGFGGLEWINL